MNSPSVCPSVTLANGLPEVARWANRLPTLTVARRLSPVMITPYTCISWSVTAGGAGGGAGGGGGGMRSGHTWRSLSKGLVAASEGATTAWRCVAATAWVSGVAASGPGCAF